MASKTPSGSEISIDRRDFLRVGAAAGISGLVGASGVSCTAFPGQKLFDPGIDPSLPDMKTYLSTVDRGMDHISNWNLSRDFAIPDASFEYQNRLAKASLRSLYLTAMFSDLPETGQMHPGMQHRMWQEVPEMDHAVFSTISYLDGLSAEERSELQRVLRDRQNPGMMIAEKIDEEAAILGLSKKRRLQTRSIFTQANFRLRKQSPDLIISEYVGKVQKMDEQCGSVAETQRHIAARMGRKQFFEKQQRLIAMAQEWERQAGNVDDADNELYMKTGDSKSRSSYTGLYIMGLGLVVGIVGALIASGGSDGGVFVVTAGVMLLVVGLITAIVQASISASKHSKNSTK